MAVVITCKKVMEILPSLMPDGHISKISHSNWRTADKVVISTKGRVLGAWK